MAARFAAIWFRHLMTDWMNRRYPELKHTAFILAASERGRMVVKAVDPRAAAKGIYTGMVVADCRAIYPDLKVLDYDAHKPKELLLAIGEWCIRYTPVVAIDLPDGLMLDISGCAHLWGGEARYLETILNRLSSFGYHVRGAIADTAATAWATSRYGNATPIIPGGGQLTALLPLPPAALRLEYATLDKLHKLGLQQIQQFIKMPRTALRRRFGEALLLRLDQALGQAIEPLQPIHPLEAYQERLPSLEPIRTATGIEIALKKLLEQLCKRLENEEKGLRSCVFKCYRVDGNIQKVSIGTTRPSRNVSHLHRLFEDKLVQIAPDLGIELFVLEAPVVEELSSRQDAIWQQKNSGDNQAVAELLDRIGGKLGGEMIYRYLPAPHHWPERSMRKGTSLTETTDTIWRSDLPRPIQMLPTPERIDVTVLEPDYPPATFTYKGEIHTVKKADGPERIEEEWWLKQGSYRDYYCIEDQYGARYWLFREGASEAGKLQWYLHGFFA